jgi:acetyltransferase-like isoleucine patch superfamily enzyme
MTDFIHHPKNPPPNSSLDAVLRRFARLSYYGFVAGVFAVAILAMACALTPALWLSARAFAWSASLGDVARHGLRGVAVAASFFVFGFALLVVIPVFNFVLPTRVKPFKGGYYTIHAVPWALHNALFYVVRYAFLKWVTLTPPGVWFLRAMGMKIGRHAFVNTELLSDPSLLTLGDDVTIGGSARICAHYGGGGNLVIEPVVIGDRATIGLAVTIMGDVRIGRGAVVLPHSAVLPGSRIGDGEVWGGVPARPIPREEMDRLRDLIRGVKRSGIDVVGPAAGG